MNRIFNIDEAKGERHTHGDKFDAVDVPISERVGAKHIGCSLIVVPPGKRAYPMHCHHVNEEMFYIVEGRGKVRIGHEEFPIKKGDVIATPAGGRDTAHQIINDSNAELRYLALSTMFPSE